jgi:hypothetical protein
MLTIRPTQQSTRVADPVYICIVGVCDAIPLSPKPCPNTPLGHFTDILVAPWLSETTIMPDPSPSRLNIVVVPLPDPRVTAEPPGISVWEPMTKAEARDVKAEAWGIAVAIAEMGMVEVPYIMYEPEACKGILITVIVRADESPGISVWPLIITMGTLIGVAIIPGAGVI